MRILIMNSHTQHLCTALHLQSTVLTSEAWHTHIREIQCFHQHKSKAGLVGELSEACDVCARTVKATVVWWDGLYTTFPKTCLNVNPVKISLWMFGVFCSYTYYQHTARGKNGCNHSHNHSLVSMERCLGWCVCGCGCNLRQMAVDIWQDVFEGFSKPWGCMGFPATL